MRASVRPSPSRPFCSRLYLCQISAPPSLPTTRLGTNYNPPNPRRFPVDSFRYYLAKDPFGGDFNFNDEALLAAHNNELADVLVRACIRAGDWDWDFFFRVRVVVVLGCRVDLILWLIRCVVIGARGPTLTYLLVYLFTNPIPFLPHNHHNTNKQK